MCGRAQSNTRLATGYDIEHVRSLRQDQRQRTGPEAFRERARLVGNVRRPIRGVIDVRDVHDDRMIGRTAFRFEDSCHRRGIARIGPESVNRLRGKRDEPAICEHRRRTSDRRVVGADNAIERVRSVRIQAFMRARRVRYERRMSMSELRSRMRSGLHR